LHSETDLDKILANDEIDVIDICTPNIYHFETIIKSLENNMHIYCEKPLVISSEQADIVMDKLGSAANRGATSQAPLFEGGGGVAAGGSDVSAAKRREDFGAGPICAVVFHNRFAPAVLRAKQIIDSGRIGRVMSFRCAFLHNSNIDPEKNAGWKQDAAIGGGGVLFDLGSHAIDLMRFLCRSDFAAVSGKSQIFFPVRKGIDGKEWRTNADEAFYVTAQLKSGAVGTIEASKLATGANSDLSFEIYGELGALKYSLMQPNFLEFYDNTKSGGDDDYGGDKGFTKIECVQKYPKPGGSFPGGKAPVGWLRFHMHCMYLYLDSVYNNSLCELSASFHDGAAVQKIMEAAYLSDRTGKWEII